MVQFIPQAQGASSFPGTKFSQFSGVGDVLGGAGQLMTQLAALKQALAQRQPAAQYFGVPNKPGATPEAPQTNPLGIFASMPVNRMKQFSDMAGAGSVSSILGQQGGTTVYWNPITGTPSLTPTEGSIPLTGFKGPQAMTSLMQSGRDQWRQDFQTKQLDYQGRLQKLRESNSLTPDQKLKLGLVNAHLRILGNPLVDLTPEESQAMKAVLDRELDDLERQAFPAGSTPPAAPTVPTTTPSPASPRPPLGGAGSPSPAGKVPKVTNQAEYNKIKKGQKYEWNGQVLTKK